MSSVLRPVRKRKKVRKLGRVDIRRREDYAELELDTKVELIRSLVPLGVLHVEGSSHKCVHDSAPAGRPRRGKRVRMRSCQLTSGAVVCRSVDGRLRGPRF